MTEYITANAEGEKWTLKTYDRSQYYSVKHVTDDIISIDKVVK